MKNLDFQQIVPRCGGQREAFEKFCCQLAYRTVPEDATYTRLHGAGGDGGVECFADLPDGNRIGWQAKYVFNIDSLLTQATESLTTALNIHPTLTRYVVCFPFDLTGPTARRGLSGTEKLDNWRKEQEQKAVAEGRQLTIEAWPAFKLLELLLEHDVSGGVREFFFNQNILTNEWFSEHLELASFCRKNQKRLYCSSLPVGFRPRKCLAARRECRENRGRAALRQPKNSGGEAQGAGPARPPDAPGEGVSSAEPPARGPAGHFFLDAWLGSI